MVEMRAIRSRWSWLAAVVVGVSAAMALMPSGVGAQGEPSEQNDPPPGPCEEGWVAPTPTNVAVTSVPIRVASTEDDYFVLYVKDHPVVDTVVWDLPVLVKRGEEGTTTLADNLAPLSADKYRVEKYSVANPADLDGDCVDDVVEIDEFGLRNPLGKIDPVKPWVGAMAIKDRAAFKKLAYKGTETPGEDDKKNTEYIKFVICGLHTRTPSIHFQNTKVFKIHLSTFRHERALSAGCRGIGIDSGILVYHPNVVAPDGSLGVYRFEFEQYREWSFKRVAYAQERLAAVLPFITDNLMYYPVGSRSREKYVAEKSLFDASRVNVLQNKDIMPDVEYVPYHEAEGYGLLSVVEPGETPGPRDIAILRTLPNNLPRVAGVITTVPQTPLSHVNLRSIQNNIPNAFIRDALSEADTDIDDLVGSHVYYKATADGFELRVATKAEVDAHYSSSRPASVQNPTRDLTVTKITALSNISFNDWDAFGVKAANMAELSKISTLATGTVPTGYGVPFYFYDEFMKANDLYADVRELLADSDFQSDFEEQEKELKKLRKKIKKATTPAWIITALENMHKLYPDGTSLRYRSSTNNEDLPDFSGAGLYDSKTQDPDETATDGIDKSIKAVWASLWNFRAFAEREHHRVDHLATAMGVLVHPNFSDELANGVAVSYDPIKGLDDTYYINTQLGEDLVTNPEANSLPEEILLAADGTPTVLAYSNLAESGKLFMSEAQMLQLRNSLKSIHDRFATLYEIKADDDFAMEIEFKITAANKLAIKQARPWVFTAALNESELFKSTLASLIADVWGYAAETGNGEAHVRRWNRVLVAFGEDVPGFSGTAMTVVEAQGHAQAFSSARWDPVVEALQRLAANPPQQPPPAVPVISITAGSDVTEGGSASFTLSASPAPSAALDVSVSVSASGDFGVTTGSRTVTIPTTGSATLSVSTSGDSVDEADGSVSVSVSSGTGYTVSSTASSATVNVADDDDAQQSVVYVVPASLVADVRGYAAETGNGVAHVNRWKQVLLAFGEDVPGFSGIPMTVADAQQHAQTFWSVRWDPVVEALQRLAANPQQPAPATPEISITASGDVTEGSAASFTLAANPAPASLLTVTVNVTASGDYGVTTGSRTVTIPTTGTASLTVATTGDSVDEADGSVSVSVSSGTGYTVSSTANSATVNVADDDVPEISITASGDVTEGSAASFTLAANPAPASLLTVTVNVTASGDYGVTTGSRTVTIPTTGTASLTVATTGDSVDEADGSVSVSVSSGTGYTVSSTASSATVNVADDDDAQQSVVYVVPASLVADVRGYAAETFNGVPHVNRWKRVLVAFGETVQGFSGTPMSVVEAQGHARTFWSVRWDPVVAALQSLAANPPQQQPTPPPATPVISITAGSGVTEGSSASFTVSASPTPASSLVVSVNVSASGSFGVTTGSRTVTVPASGSATLSVSTSGDSTDEPDGSVTVSVTDAAAYDVSSTAGSATVSVADDDDPPPPPPVTPVVSVTAGGGVTEGSAALFTVSASPVPSSSLVVTVNVTASGSFGVKTGSRTVTVPTSGSATLSVSTSGDSTDEPDGSVTVSVADAAAYDVSSTAGSATVAISDDDDPPPPPPPATPVVVGDVKVSVDGQLERVGPGGTLEFVVTLSKAADADVKVGFKVSAVGGAWLTVGLDYVVRGLADKSDSVGELTFARGETRQVLYVDVPKDAWIFASATILVALTSASGGVEIDSDSGSGSAIGRLRP